MNILDSVIGYISPGRAVRRWQAREALRQIRAFEGAKQGRRNAGWRTTGASANVENITALPVLRNRSRDLVRNNAWCKKALCSWVGNAIGQGIRCNLQSDKQLGKLWKRWADSTLCDADGDLNLYGLQELAARTMWESGSVIIRLRWRRLSDGLPVPLQLQVLEPDYIDLNKTDNLKNGGRIVGGKEYDPIGRLVAYWMFEDHPGEGGRWFRSYESRRVDAKDVLHVFRKTRPGQIHGIPELAPVVMRARDLDDYEDAELTKKKIEACFTTFITGDDAGGSGINVGQQEREPGNPKRLIEKMAPGLIKYLKPGQDVKFAVPTPTAGYPDYTRSQQRALAAGVGVTFEQLTGDYSQVNYASSRAGLLEFRRSVEQWQWLTFVPGLCNPIAEAFLQAATMIGKWHGGELKVALDWTTPRWDWVDPVKDVIGDLLEVAAGGKSLSEFVRQRGYEPDEVWDELSKDYAKIKQAGIPINLNNLIVLMAKSLQDDWDQSKAA